MKLKKIKNGFYTDGKTLYSNIGGCVSEWLPSYSEAKDMTYLAYGTNAARVEAGRLDTEVKPVKEGMSFCNREITVLDKNTVEVIEIKPINPQYNNKGYCIKHDGYKTINARYNSKFQKV